MRPTLSTLLAALPLVAAISLSSSAARADEELTSVGAVGAVATGLGGLSAFGGGIYWIASTCQGPRCGDPETTRWMAIAFSVGGALLLAAGISMFVLGREESPRSAAQTSFAPLVRF